MAKKNRRRNKPKSQQRDDEYFDEEENQPLAKGTDIIDDNVLRLLRHLNIHIKVSLFKDYGYQCVEYDWATIKTGINGRNAARAHLKKHRNEQRAQNPLRLQVWVGVITLFLIALLSSWSFIDPEIPHIPTDWLGETAFAGPVLLVASAISAYGLSTFQKLYSHDLSKPWRAGYLWSLILGSLVLVTELWIVWGFTSIDVPTPWLMSGVLPVWALTATRSKFGKAKLRYSRRERRSTNYVRRFIAKTADGDEEFTQIQLKIAAMVLSELSVGAE